MRVFAQADCVTATGSDETLEALRRRLPPNVRFIGHGTRVSFGYVAREMLSRSEARQIAALVASDVAAWDQAGCLSPHLVYVEHGGSVGPPQFAPDFVIEQLRGNVDTRLRKLKEGQYDAIILAAAGVKRLGLADNVTEYIDAGVSVPAIGQGALGIECRVDDVSLMI